MVKEISEIIEEISPYYKKIKSKKGKLRRDTVPAEAHKLIYDSSSETLEPVYFWIVDLMSDFLFGGGKVEKLVDNFTSSPGGGHFAELSSRATRMQEEGMKVMQTIGILIKSLINIIYDLRQFELRFNDYDASKSKDQNRAEAGHLALKQIWLDNVDIKRGNTSIKALTFSQTAFATLIDAFMIAKSEKDVKGLDLNERVKRLLLQRIIEFNKWKDLSEKELRKRYEIQRSWLKSQVNSLKLYSRWVKPYLVAAEKLRMQETGREAALVTAFNTIVLQLTLLGKNKIDPQEAAIDKNLPQEFRKLKTKRDYYSCVLVDLTFRGIPQRAGTGQYSHYVFGGKVEANFRGYCLNQDELDLLDEELRESDISSALQLVEGATTESLGQLQEDIEYFLKDEKERKLEQKAEIENEDVNPFSALIGRGKKEKKEKISKEDKEKEKQKQKIGNMKEKGIRPDNYAESLIRSLGELSSGSTCFKVFDVYKKAHGMASHPDPYDLI